jgi:uncharacterized protein (DUF3084 family)
MPAVRRVALLFSVIAVSAAAADEGAVERPQIKAGERWTYRFTRTGPKVKHPKVRVYELLVTFVGPKAVQSVQTQPDGRQFDTTWTPEWNVVNDMRSGSFFPDSGVFRFPLRPGATYASTYEVVRPKADTTDAKHTLEVRVAGWEEVTVPAGTFRALRVDATGTSQRLDRYTRRAGTVHYVYWYVPEVKRWAKMTMEGFDGRGLPAAQESEELVFYGSE